MIQQTSDRIVQYQNEMKILILYGVIGSMATVDSALFSSSSTTRVIKMMVLSLLHISLNRALAKLRVWLKHSAHRPIPISKSPRLKTLPAPCAAMPSGCLWQYRIILSADTAIEVRQMLSQKRR